MHHCWILPDHPLREQVETFICNRYWLNFNACLRTLPRLLIAVFDDEVLVAACGVQLADEQRLFSQTYLNQPLHAYQVSSRPLPAAEQLAEVGSRCFSTELSKKTVLSNRRITLNFLNIGGI